MYPGIKNLSFQVTAILISVNVTVTLGMSHDARFRPGLTKTRLGSYRRRLEA